MATTKEELVTTFTTLDLIMDVARLTLLGIDKLPKQKGFPVPPPMQPIESILRCIPFGSNLGGIRDDLEFTKRHIDREAKTTFPFDEED